METLNEMRSTLMGYLLSVDGGIEDGTKDGCTEEDLAPYVQMQKGLEEALAGLDKIIKRAEHYNNK